MAMTKRSVDIAGEANGDGPSEAKRPSRPPPDDEIQDSYDELNSGDGDLVLNNIDLWVEENEEFFQPPVCNKLMHQDGQMKVFFVGGPNERVDYHIEEGEELFYMLKGDMCLKIVEKGKHRDIDIKEGEIFLLPARIPHSPQRKEGTIGMVIERERLPQEQDGLRYFVEKDGKLTMDILYEKWFHCEDLGPQLAAIIKEYFNTDQYKTGKPIPGAVSKTPPVQIDSDISIADPVDLKDWLDEHSEAIENEGSIILYGKGSQFEVVLYGEGDFSGQRDGIESLLWQLQGTSDISVEEGEACSLEENDTLLVKAGDSYEVTVAEDSFILVCYQDPSKKKTT